MEWKDVTNNFSERERHYKNTYLEIDEVYNEDLELSLFSSEEDDYEIYFSYGRFYGIVYAKAEEALTVREKMKKELEAEYNKAREPSSEFINQFAAKYDVQMPADIYFDVDIAKLSEQIDDIFGIK